MTPLDQLTSALERRWGIGRLPLLVSPELRARWDATLVACQNDDTPQQDKDAMLVRAWKALDAAATAAGAEHLPPGLWEVPDPVDPDGVIVICRDELHAHTERLRATHDGRHVLTYTLAEVANVMHAHRMPLAHAIKREWPGATVLPPRPARWKDCPVPRIAENMILDAE